MAGPGSAGISGDARTPHFDHPRRDFSFRFGVRQTGPGRVRKSHWLSDRSPLLLHYTLAHRQSAAAAELAHWVARALAKRSFSVFF
jgi:hypothetical protein